MSFETGNDYNLFKTLLIITTISGKEVYKKDHISV